MGKSRTQTTTQKLDPASQAYVNQMRQAAAGAAGQMGSAGPMFTGEITPEQIQAAMNPFLSNVVGSVRGEFDHLRDQAATGINQQATMSGAFGGSRHGVAQGVRMGELDRAQTGQIADLMNQGYGQALGFAGHQQQLRQQQMMEPMFRNQQAMQFWNMGMGPVGMTGSTTTPGNLIGDLAGLGMIGGGMGLFGGIGKTLFPNAGRAP